MTKIIFLCGLLISLTCTTGFGQLVTEKFTENKFLDNFDSDNGTWKIMSSADNLFLIQDGKYFIQRKQNKTAYSIFPKWESPPSSFEISATINIQSTPLTESSAGIIFMAQADGSGAFVFEINDKKQYRLKQLVGVNFKLLTGTSKSNGWVESQILNDKDQNNLVQVKSSNRNYDIFINQNYILSFTELAYKAGEIGISVGPDSKFTVDQISVYTTIDDKKEIKTIKPEIESLQLDSHAIMLKELRLLREENKLLKDSLKAIRAEKKKSTPKTINQDSSIIEPQKHPE